MLPEGKALYSFMDEFENTSLSQIRLVEDNGHSQDGAGSESVEQVENVSQRETTKWINNRAVSAWKPDAAGWNDGILEKSALVELLKYVDELGDYYSATSLCDRTQLEGPCLDLAVRAMVLRTRDEDVVFTNPVDILRSPHFDLHSIKAQHVWKEMKDTATVINLTERNGINKATSFVAVINVDLNHWCAVVVDYKEYTVNIYDPQQAGGRHEA
ncbi:hypothetical protein PHMEG_00030932 [Phytophthora megakarya]|uniref:Ubiquitin-like protease family profile domain-containing protein n=1 Tax=Phytophthora megakarya TaxID=4795 RepID=A0A225UZS7_9STRA|nr:hypothetical protein PHMEG_00030932 [Phytophthora megakarya]